MFFIPFFNFINFSKPVNAAGSVYISSASCSTLVRGNSADLTIKVKNATGATINDVKIELSELKSDEIYATGNMSSPTYTKEASDPIKDADGIDTYTFSIRNNFV